MCYSDQILCIGWNCNSWGREKAPDKTLVLSSSNANIILLCETWLRQGESISIAGYKFIGNNRKYLHKNACSGSGGVAILIRESLLENYVIENVDTSYDCILAVQIRNQICDTCLVFVCVYVPPDTSRRGREEAESIIEHLTQLLYQFEDSDHIYVYGDFNGRVGDKPDYIESIDEVKARVNIDDTTNKHGEALLELLISLKMAIGNGRVTPEKDNFTSITKKGLTVIDYWLAGYESFTCIDRCEVVPISDYVANMNLQVGPRLSDHSLLFMNIKICGDVAGMDEEEDMGHISTTNCHYEKPIKYRVREVPPQYMQSPEVLREFEGLITDLLEAKLDQQKVDGWYSNFLSTLYKEIDHFFKRFKDTPQTKKNYNMMSKPWWTDFLGILNKKVHSAEKQWRFRKKHRLPCNYEHAEFKKHQKVFDKEARRLKRRWKREQVINLDKLNFDDPNDFWESIKRMGRKQKTKIPEEVYADDGSIATDLGEVLGRWETDYGSLFSGNLNDIETGLYIKHIRGLNEEFEKIDSFGPRMCYDRTFYRFEVEKIVNKAKEHKAPGFDGIVSEFLKNRVCIDALTALFNKCHETGLLPSNWLRALISPIPKNLSSDPRVPLNYRGISLLPVVSKMYTALVGDRVGGFLEENDILVNEQNGFRPGRSCVDHIFVLHDLLRIRKANNMETFCTFIDFQKAFDCVNHEFLLYKLSQNGITGRSYQSIKSMYRSPLSCVNIGGKLTNWFPVRAGVRQGDSLSPTLFALFINDLAVEVSEANLGVMINDVQQLSILLYADDVVLIAPTHQNMQKLLDIVTAWCRRWAMSVNPLKTQVIHVRNPQRPRCDRDLFLCLREVSCVSNYKYLGCWINEFMNNDKTVESLTLAAGRSFGRIVNIFKKMGDMGYQTYDTLCHSYVLPVANYAAGVWGFKDYPAPQVLQNRITRFYLGVHRFAPVPATKLEMDWLDMKHHRWLDIIRLYNRICAMDRSKLPRVVLEWDYKVGAKGWLKDMLQVCTESEVPAPTELKYVYDLEPIQAKFLKQCRMEWRSAAEKMPKLDTYNVVKDFTETAILVRSNLPRNERSLVARLLCGILPLEIETGRYKDKNKNKDKTERKQRYCKVCESKSVEDEVHFVFCCTALESIRKAKLEPILLKDRETHRLNNNDKLQWLTNKENMKEFGQALACLYQGRHEALFNKNRPEHWRFRFIHQPEGRCMHRDRMV